MKAVQKKPGTLTKSANKKKQKEESSDEGETPQVSQVSLYIWQTTFLTLMGSLIFILVSCRRKPYMLQGLDIFPSKGPLEPGSTF